MTYPNSNEFSQAPAEELNVRVTSANKFFIVLFGLMVLFSLFLGRWHGTTMLALLVGVPLAVIPCFLIRVAPFAFFTRFAVGASLMLFCALNIHQAHAMVEMHFGIFVLLALLLFYEDWRVLVGAAAVIAVHHLVFCYLQNAGYGIMCFPNNGYTQVLIHAAYVVVETAALCFLAVTMDRKTKLAVTSAATIRQQFALSTRTLAEQTRYIEAITEASKKLAASSEAIASGAHEQAASLEETSASLEQITATMRMGADHAREASVLASSSGEAAGQGGRVVSEAVTAMSEISQASAKISDIISTINEIAFQTNLLAVNAAVEAARAGEEGRGFAVVASEVRSLALRTSEASKSIKELIEDSLAKVRRGTELVNRSGQTLESIMSSVGRVGQIVSQMAEASEQQTQGIDQVNIAMTQMDQVTQTNSRETDAVAATARSLFEDAARLLELASGNAVPAE